MLNVVPSNSCFSPRLSCKPEVIRSYSSILSVFLLWRRGRFTPRTPVGLRGPPRRISMAAVVGSFSVDHERVLGEGGFSRVFAARSDSGTPAAAKQIFIAPACPPLNVQASSREETDRELAALRAVGQHPFIIQLHEYCALAEHPRPEFCNSSFFFLELATGGELFDRMTDGGCMPEHQIRPYLACMASALDHCHRLGITHGDVKLENALVLAEQPQIVKLAVCVVQLPAASSPPTARLPRSTRLLCTLHAARAPRTRTSHASPTRLPRVSYNPRPSATHSLA